jgi:hypothetical protein
MRAGKAEKVTKKVNQQQARLYFAAMLNAVDPERDFLQRAHVFLTARHLHTSMALLRSSNFFPLHLTHRAFLDYLQMHYG